MSWQSWIFLVFAAFFLCSGCVLSGFAIARHPAATARGHWPAFCAIASAVLAVVTAIRFYRDPTPLRQGILFGVGGLLILDGACRFLFGFSQRRRKRRRRGIESTDEEPSLQVEVLEQPTAYFLTPMDRRRMVTFPKVAVKNTTSEPQRVGLRLAFDDWDEVIIPPYEPPDFFARGGPTRLPKVIDIQPGEQLTGKIEFRIPFSGASADSVFFRLVLAKPATEVVVSEFTVPLTVASYLKPPAPP